MTKDEQTNITSTQANALKFIRKQGFSAEVTIPSNKTTFFGQTEF